MPALLNMRCSPPNRSTATSTAACTWSMSLTSVTWNARRHQLGGERLSRVGIDIGDDDPGAGGDEPPGRRRTDAPGPAGDDRDLPASSRSVIGRTLRSAPDGRHDGTCRSARSPVEGVRSRARRVTARDRRSGLATGSDVELA